MNEQQKLFLQGLGFEFSGNGFYLHTNETLEMFPSDCVEVRGYREFGREEIKAEISIWSSSDRSLDKAKAVQKDIEKAIRIAEKYEKLGE